MTKKNEIKKVESKNQEVSKYDFIICPNCGAEEVGKFCPSCGQSNKDYNKPIKEIFGDLLDSINLDIRLLNTIIPFFTKPGYLAQEYFKGKRKKYVPPMRMYMFVSIIFFFLAHTADIENFEGNGNISSEAVADSISKELATTILNPDSNFVDLQGLNKSLQLANIDTNLFKDIRTDFLKDYGKNDTTNTDSSSDMLKLSLEEKRMLIEELKSDSTIPEAITNGMDSSLNVWEEKEVLYQKFLDNSSYVLFLLMPFFALILAMTLSNSRKLYVHHLIFSINFHSFIFGLSCLLILLYKIPHFQSSEIIAYLLWGYPLYLMFGIHKFYKRSYLRSFFKTIGISLLYLFVIFVVMIIIIVITTKDYY